jgi:hypothetical protein
MIPGSAMGIFPWLKIPIVTMVWEPVEFRFNASPGILRSYVSSLTSSGQCSRAPTSEVGYTWATAGREDHEVYKGHVVALRGGGGLWK